MSQNDHVTYETAKALKDAGYPQPDFATGQVWYNEHGAATHITRNEGEGNFTVTSLLSARQQMFQPIKEGAYFRPEFTDLLDALGPGATVRALGLGEFEVTDDPNRKPIVTNNPCEALGRLILENAKHLFRQVETADKQP